jgi:hypothetical protein
MPSSLAEILDAFGAALLDPARPVPAGAVGPDRRPDTKRFAVYRNNVVHGLVNALEARFPVTSRLVGKAFFRSMARVYAATHLPRTPLLTQYGDDFPGMSPVSSAPGARRFTPPRRFPSTPNGWRACARTSWQHRACGCIRPCACCAHRIRSRRSGLRTRPQAT